MKINDKKLFRYTIGEDVANAVSHLIGFIISVICLMHMVYLAGTKQNALYALSVIIFGLSANFMFAMSTLYHAIWHRTTRIIFKILDHSAIFIVIVGTFTPFIVMINSFNQYILYICLWVLTIIGIIIKVFYVGRFQKTLTFIFLAMGWSSLLMIPEIYANFGITPIIYLAIGGLFYTIGAIIYAFSKFKYHHLIWHIFIVLAYLSQYLAVTILIK